MQDELLRMKENNNQPEGAAAVGSNPGWNARRSYNLLKLSLGQPMTIPPSEIKEIDEELLMNPDANEEGIEVGDKSTSEEEVNVISLTDGKALNGVAEESDHSDEDVVSAVETADTTLCLTTPGFSISPNVKEGRKNETSIAPASGLPKSPLSVALRISKAFASTTDQLAASLTRGIEILDNHPRTSVSLLRR